MLVTIRHMELADVPAALSLCRYSGWNQLEEDWQMFLDSPNGSGWLAVHEGTGIGTVTVLRYETGFTWLSMMLVHPDFRHARIGTQLMAAAIETLTDETCVRLDATPLGEPLYRRFGFQGECELARSRIVATSIPYAALAEDVRPMQAGDLPVVFAFDRKVFGADRSALLQSFYHRAPDLAWMLYRGDTLAGYCFGRTGYLCRQLGPVVSEDITAAKALVARCLSAHGGEEFFLDIPLSAPEWIAWLKPVGASVERPFLRMYRGRTPERGLAARQFAIAGPEFG